MENDNDVVQHNNKQQTAMVRNTSSLLKPLETLLLIYDQTNTILHIFIKTHLFKISISSINSIHTVNPNKS